MIDFKYRKMAAVCGILTASLLLSACSAGRYEAITLTQSPVAKGNFSESSSDDAEGDASSEAATVAPIILDDGQEVDATAVAGTSPLDSDLTTDSGFEERNETVYATENLVNIRSGCGKDFKIVTQINMGDSIIRTGYSEGWSRVVYEDQICYAVSDYLTAENSESAAAAEVQAFSGTPAPQAAVAAAVTNGRIVAIDAGHQAKGNSEKEPIGPGSSTMKEKVATGTEGISTGLPEYKLTLSVSQKLKRILEERGYQVVMIRESNDVNLSNAERARIANKSGASAFVRIHANSLDNSNVTGVLTMCQTSGNPYNGEQHEKSYSLSRKITDSISALTGFKNRGVQETDTMSGINWCTIPVSIVEMGFMSNPEEDQKMAQDEYQEQIAAGIADGIDAYFGE